MYTLAVCETFVINDSVLERNVNRAKDARVGHFKSNTWPCRFVTDVYSQVQQNMFVSRIDFKYFLVIINYVVRRKNYDKSIYL